MNEQKPIAADYQKDASILVHSIFKTIQGEGPFCGERALFIRLYGCNLRCPGCDTEYTKKQQRMLPGEIVERAYMLDWPRNALIVLTGGEPFRQNVIPSIYALLSAGYRVQVETNGIFAPPDLDRLEHFKTFSIVCSPKTSSIHHGIMSRALAFKYVVRVGQIADDGLPTRALMHKATPYVSRPRKGALVYVQPMDEGHENLNAENTAAAIESAMAHGYTLQIQTHKILGLE